MTGMTDIVTAMHKAGISQRKAAADLGISPAAVNLIINKGIWPRTDTEAVKARFTAWAQSLGITEPRHNGYTIGGYRNDSQADTYSQGPARFQHHA